MSLPLANLLSQTAVRCGTLLVPYRTVQDVLARSVRPLIFENEDPAFLYSRPGTSTLLTYKGRHFAFFTRHQAGSFNPEAARIVQGFFGGPSFPFKSLFRISPDSDEEYEEIQALELARTEKVSFTALTNFFSLEEIAPDIEDSRLLIAIGVPTATSAVEYEPPHIRAQTVTLPCRYNGKLMGPARMHHLHIIRTRTTTTPLDLDGMSGGAVFSIDGRFGNYQTHFRGLITRGGNDNLYVIDAPFIRQMIDTMDE